MLDAIFSAPPPTEPAAVVAVDPPNFEGEHYIMFGDASTGRKAYLQNRRLWMRRDRVGTAPAQHRMLSIQELESGDYSFVKLELRLAVIEEMKKPQFAAVKPLVPVTPEEHLDALDGQLKSNAAKYYDHHSGGVIFRHQMQNLNQ